MVTLSLHLPWVSSGRDEWVWKEVALQLRYKVAQRGLSLVRWWFNSIDLAFWEEKSLWKRFRARAVISLRS